MTDPVWRNRGEEEARALPSAKYSPYFVFVDAQGNKVFETRGFNNPLEAKAMHAYISGRHYRDKTWGVFLASYSK